MTSHYYQSGNSLPHWRAITINSKLSTIDGHQRTNISFKIANWARYAEACDKYLSEAGEARSVEQAEKTVRKVVNKDSDLISVSRIPHFQSTLSASAKSLADVQDRKRRLIAADETLNDLIK